MKQILPMVLTPFILFAESLHVHIGTNDFLLAFADASISMSMRTTIAVDLEQEYASLTNKPIVFQEGDTSGRIRFNAYGISPYQDHVRLPFTYSIDPVSGARGLEVKKGLSDKYAAAVALWNANTNVILQGISFVESLRNGLLSSVSSNEVSQIFYHEGASVDSLEASKDRLSHFLDNLTLLNPGLLSFFLSTEDCAGAGEVLIMAIPCIDACNDGLHDVIPALWIDNKWKLLLGE